MSSQRVVEKCWGMFGLVVEVQETEQETLVTIAVSAEKEGVASESKTFDGDDVVFLGNETPATREKVRQCNYMSAALYNLARAYWFRQPFEDVEPVENTLLDTMEVACGAWEIIWRLLPRRTIVVDSGDNSILAQIGWLEGAKDYVNSVEDQGLREAFDELASRADLLLMPIFHTDRLASNGHWTLLVAERASSEPVPASTSSAAGSSEASTAGCASCRNTRCAACDPALAVKDAERKAEEGFAARPHTLPVLPGQPCWKVRYYESLPHIRQGNAYLAQGLLRYLGLPMVLPAREGMKKQKGCECGYHVLHNIEEECRRKLGETKWSMAYDLAFRVERLQKMRKKIMDF